jgi:NTE family protein
VAASGGKVFGSDAPAYESFSLGGPLRLSSYRIDELAGKEYAFGRLMVYRRAVALPDILGSGVYVGGSAEVGRVDDRAFGLSSPGTVWSGSLFLGADTFLGPLYFGAGYGANDRWSLYLLMGAP